MATIILGDIVEVIKETVHNPQESGFQYFVGLEHYDSGEPLITRYATPDNLTSSVKHFAKGDILVARRNVYLKRASLVDFEGVTSGDSIVLRAKDKKYQQILPFILNSDDFWDYAEQNSDGTMSKRLSPADLLDYEFEEPENIELLADKLWAAYRVKESYKKLLAATDDMLKAKFQEMFGEEEKNGRIADLVCGEIMSVKKTYKPEDIISYIDISSVNAETNRIIGITDYIVKSAPSRAQQCVQYGDILVSTTRPMNRNIAIVHSKTKNLVASTGFCVLRPKEGYSDYLMTIVKSNEYTMAMCDKATGGVYPAVNNSDVLSYRIVIPTEKILTKISNIYTQAEATKESLRKSIENIDQVIKSLINQ